MIEAAERAERIGPGSHIVEPTSGNTGIALAFIAASRGYRLTLTMPETMSIERRILLSLLGAQLELTPAALGMKGAVQRAEEIASADLNAWIPQRLKLFKTSTDAPSSTDFARSKASSTTHSTAS
jgi:cysteine synthase A